MSKRSLRSSFIVNLVSPSVRIVVAFVTIPIYLHHVGVARYGVISITWVLLGFFGFLDLGLSRAVTNALAKLRDAPQSDRARVLLTTLGLNFIIGLFGGAVLFVFGAFLLEYFISVPDELKSEVSRSLPWIACLLPLTLLSTAGAGALESRELFPLVNAIQIVGTTVTQVAPVIMAVFVSPSLTVVIPTQAVAQGLGAIAVLAVVYRLEGPFSLRAIDWREARKLLGYGGWMFATNVATPALASADQFVIGSAMGVGAVAHYSVPMNLVLRSGAIPVAFGRTFFPRMSSLSGDAAHVLAVRGLSSMAYGFAAVCAPAIILSPTFFRYWIGADFAAISAPVAQFLFPGMWMAGLSFVGFTLLQSQGRADVTGKLNLIEFLPFLAILWGLTQAFRDRWRCCRLEFAVHDRWVGDILGFRNKEEGPPSFGAPGDTFDRHFVRCPLSGLPLSSRFSRRDVRRDRSGGAQLFLLGGLARDSKFAGEPGACFHKRSREPDEAASAR